MHQVPSEGKSQPDREAGLAFDKHDPPVRGQEYSAQYVEWYVCERPLVHPRFNAFTFILLVLAAAAAGLGTGCAVWLLAGCRWRLSTVLWASTGVTLLGNLRVLIIGMVKLYQHYMPECYRRNCVLLPTCSEYCILALKKYGVIRGCYKTAHRLIHTCVGWDYRTDWP